LSIYLHDPRQTADSLIHELIINWKDSIIIKFEYERVFQDRGKYFRIYK
jgi:hypothetical protein